MNDGRLDPNAKCPKVDFAVFKRWSSNFETKTGDLPNAGSVLAAREPMKGIFGAAHFLIGWTARKPC